MLCLGLWTVTMFYSDFMDANAFRLIRFLPRCTFLISNFLKLSTMMALVHPEHDDGIKVCISNSEGNISLTNLIILWSLKSAGYVMLRFVHCTDL